MKSLLIWATLGGLGLLAHSALQAEILYYDGFPTGSGVYAAAGAKLTGQKISNTSSVLGFAAGYWENSTTTIYSFPDGLPLPESFASLASAAYVGVGSGGARSGGAYDERGNYRTFKADVQAGIKDASELHFRCLLQSDAKAMGSLQAKSISGGVTDNLGCSAFGGGVVQPENGHSLAYGTWHNSVGDTACSIGFGIRRESDADYRVSFVVKGATDAGIRVFDLVESVEPGVPYICYAKVLVDQDGPDTIRAFVQKVSDYRRCTDFAVLTTAEIVDATDGIGPKAVNISTGSYGTNNGYSRIDELTLATTAAEVMDLDPSAPQFASIVMDAQDGLPRVALGVTENDADVTLEAEATDGTILAYDLGSARADGAAVSAALTGLSAGTTYVIRARLTNGGSVITRPIGYAYGSSPTVEVVREADENGLVPAQIRISRAGADSFPLTVSYATADGTAIAGTGYNAAVGQATIPAGETSVIVEVKPRVDPSSDATAFGFSVTGPFVGSADPVSVGIRNYTYPEGKNCWTGSTGDGLASTADNWSLGLPTEDSDIELGSYGPGSLTWDAGVNGLPSTVKSWTQGEGYPGTVTFLTTFPEYARSEFKTFTVKGSCDIRGGTWTHPVSVSKPNDSTPYKLAEVRAMRTYRLDVAVGSLTLGSGARIDAKGKGMVQAPTTASGRAANYGPSAHGGCPLNSWTGCYGDVKFPVDIGFAGSIATDGAGTKHGAGGGAIKIKVADAMTVDGVITADGARGTGSSLAAGSAGSVLIEAKSVSGSGAICADGVSCGNTGQTNGSGGRIAIYTETPVDCSTLTLSAGAMTTEGKIAASGTVYLKDATKSHGVLRIVNRFSSNADATPGYTVEVNGEGDWTFDEIVLGGQANLTVGEGATLTLPNGLASVSAPDNTSRATGLFYRGGTLAVGSGDQTLSGKWYFAPTTPFTFLANVTLADGAAIGFPNPYGQPKVATEAAYNALEKISCTVTGDLTVPSGCAVTVTGSGSGYTADSPSWYPIKLGAHGGAFSMRSKNKETYTEVTTTHDSVFAPHLLPLQTQAYAYVRTGGVLGLSVGGALVLDGSIVADGASSGGCLYYAVPGALDITAGSIRGGGTISASAKGTGQGGGRVAVKLTDKDADFAAFTGKIGADNNENVLETIANNSYMSSPGTIYLEKGNDGAKRGEIRIHGATAGKSTVATPICANGYMPDEVADFKDASLVLSGTARASVAVADEAGLFRMRSLTISDSAKLDLVGHAFTVKSATVNGSRLSPGTYTPASAGLADCLVDTAAAGGGQLIVSGGGLIMVVR